MPCAISLDRIISNLGQMRNEHWMGSDYIVCPVRMIVSGVLDGSQGPLYYPPDEIENSVNAWNGIPIVVYHPVENGMNVSARNPSVMEKSFIGWVFNCIYNAETESLDGEAWLSKSRLEECDNQLEPKYQILPRLQANMPIEVSTGLGTSNQIANDDFNRCPKTGKPFTHIARNFKPDHLAVLPDREGACSINDGCGLGTNQSSVTNPGHVDEAKWKKAKEIAAKEGRAEDYAYITGIYKKMTGNESPTIETSNETVTSTNSNIEGTMKKSLIAFITTNCDCWKSPEDKATLNTFSEAKLKQIKNGIIDGKLARMVLGGLKAPAILSNARKVKAITTNADGEQQIAEGVSLTDLADFFKVDIDPSSDPMGYIDAIKAELEKALSKLGGSAAPPTPANQDGMDSEDMMDEEKDKKEGVPVTMEDGKDNTTNRKKSNMPNKPLTTEEWMRLAPEPVRQVVSNAMKQNEQRHAQLVDMLVNHHANDEHNRAMLKPIYGSMSLDKLEILASTIPQTQTVLAPSYIGMAGGTYNASHDDGSKDVESLPLPWDHK